MEIAGSFRDLRTYRLAREAARSIFRMTRTFPAEERYSLTDHKVNTRSLLKRP